MKKLDVDLAILGAGVAGLAAAIKAAEKGEKVALFEKTARTGGCANGGMGPFAVESRLQRRRQYNLSKEEAFKIHMDFTQWNVNARLVKNYIDRSANTLDWLKRSA